MGLFGMAMSYLLFSLLHFTQFVLALAVIGLYGQDLSNARNAGVAPDSKWIFAVVVGAISAATAIAYCVPFILRFAVVSLWSTIVLILWIAVFGVFGNMFIKENPEGNSGVQRMKNAVWVDLANVVLWFLGTIASAGYWWTHRERSSRFTGRAKLGRNPSTRSGWTA